MRFSRCPKAGSDRAESTGQRPPPAASTRRAAQPLKKGGTSLPSRIGP